MVRNKPHHDHQYVANHTSNLNQTGFFHHLHHHKDKDKKEHDHHSHQAAHTAPQQRHGHFDPGDYLTDVQFEDQFPGLSATSCSNQHVHTSACGARQTRAVQVSHCQAHVQPVHHPVQTHQCHASQHPVQEQKEQPNPQGDQKDPAIHMPDYRDYVPPTQAHAPAPQSPSPAFPEPSVAQKDVAAAVAAIAINQSGPQDYRPPEGPPPGYQAVLPSTSVPPPSEPKPEPWSAQMDPDAIGMVAAMEAMQMMQIEAPAGSDGTPQDMAKMNPDVIGMAAAMEAMQMMNAKQGNMDTATPNPPAVTGTGGKTTAAVANPPAPPTSPAKAKVEVKASEPEPEPETKPAPTPTPAQANAAASSRPTKPSKDADTPDGIAGLLGAGSSPQDKLLAVAIAQAARLFDKKNGGKPLDPAVKKMKVQALNSAANTVLRLASQFRMSGKIMPNPGEIQGLINTALDLF